MTRKFRLRPGQKTTNLGTNLTFSVLEDTDGRLRFNHRTVSHHYVICESSFAWQVIKCDLETENPQTQIGHNLSDPYDAAASLERYLTAQTERVSLKVLRVMVDTLTCTLTRKPSKDVWILGSRRNLERLARAISRQFRFDPRIKVGEKIDGKPQPGYPRIELHGSTFH